MFIFYENPSIHLKYAHQFGVNLFCEECSCSNKGALMPPPSVEICRHVRHYTGKNGHYEMI